MSYMTPEEVSDLLGIKKREVLRRFKRGEYSGIVRARKTLIERGSIPYAEIPQGKTLLDIVREIGVDGNRIHHVGRSILDAVRMSTPFVDASYPDIVRWYCLYHGLDKLPTCPICGKPAKWQKSVAKFSIYCGSSCSNSSDAIKNKLGRYIDTLQKKHGVNNSFQIPEIREKAVAEYRKRYSGKLRTKEEVENSTLKASMARLRNNYTKIVGCLRGRGLSLQTSIDDFCTKRECDITCSSCGKTHHIPSGKALRFNCNTCNGAKTSIGENSIAEYLCSVGCSVERHVKILSKTGNTLQKRAYVDIYIPDKRVAIEFNGLYWHSEKVLHTKFSNRIHRGKISPTIVSRYHEDKFNICSSAGVRVIQIFEHEWHLKRDIVNSILKCAIGACDNRVYARKCTVTKLSNDSCDEFLDRTHIQGRPRTTSTRVNFALIYNRKIVSVMVFDTNSKIQGVEWEKVELVRNSSELNTCVVGGFSKLLKHFIDEYSPESIVTYIDNRFFTGETYLAQSFKHCGNVPPRYFYFKMVSEVKKYSILSRNMAQKGKLARLGADPTGRTETEMASQLKYSKVYDAGKKILVWRPQKSGSPDNPDSPTTYTS